MNISGWEIDLPSVYGSLWEQRAQFHLTESLYESPDGRWAVLLFGLGEVGTNKQVGPLALFREKAAPVLVYHSGRTSFWCEGIAGEPVGFATDGRGARVVELLQSRPDRLGSRERTLDFAAGGLVPLSARSPSLRERWQSFRADHKVVAILLPVLLTGAAVAPLVLFVGIILEHRRDTEMITRGRELRGRVVEFPGSPLTSDWSRVRVETAPGSTIDYVVHERLPVGRELTLVQDPLTGEVRTKDEATRGLTRWPWDLLVWMLILSPLYIGIPWRIWRIGRTAVSS